MKYYLVVGEASGDLHASHLMAAIKERDPEAEFRYFGGDLMQAQGGRLFRHYKTLAYMGFIQVALHAVTILKGIKACKLDILTWLPDVLILVDYPGFNLKIAHYVHSRKLCPVVYYISPKIWAWKERRIKNIQNDVDQLLSILPFEKKFYEEKHHYPIHYVGNPTLDEVLNFQEGQGTRDKGQGTKDKGEGLTSSSTSIVALLAGSRKQEIKKNLRIMLKAAKPWMDQYQIVVAGAPSIDASFYQRYLKAYPKVQIRFGQTFEILSQATAALVTSGTATLETALFGVPQVVCYATPFPHIVSLIRPRFLKVKYISLVNLILDKIAVPELIAADMNIKNCRAALASILPKGKARTQQLKDYTHLRHLLGEPGAPIHAAAIIVDKVTG